MTRNTGGQAGRPAVPDWSADATPHGSNCSMRISLVIPAHNEQARIGPMLEAYLSFLAGRYGDVFEVIVVVNGSTDETAGVVNSFASRYPQLRCIVEPRGVGKGGALIMGFRETRGDLVGFVDADGSTPPEAFQDLIDRIGPADVAVASRWCRGATVSPRQALARRIASRVFNLLTRVLFGLRLTDTQCGAKLMRRQALLAVLDRLGITRWAFDVDLLFQLRRAGKMIVEIPTTWRDVAGSKLQILSVSAEMFAAIVRLRLLYSPFKWVVGAYDFLVGPVIHPEGPERDHLFGHSLILLACAQVANVGNLVFQAVMMRMLDDVQYGTLAAMLALFAVITMPLGGLPWALAHFTAGFLREGRGELAGSMLAAVAGDIAFSGVLALLPALAITPALAVYFRLDGAAPLLITLVAVFVSVVGSIFMGGLQGVQAFVWISGINVAWSVSRLLLATSFVVLGGAAVGALLGHAAAMVVLVLAGSLGVRCTLGSRRAPPERPNGFYSYCIQYASAYVGYALLMNADVMLAKHFFASEEAGHYAIVAMIGRIVLFLPQPIVMAMFPKVASAGEVTQANWRTLAKALILAGLLISATAVVCSVFAETVLGALSGSASRELVPLLRLMVWGLVPLSLTFFIMNFELAQRRFTIAMPILICAGVYVACLSRWHDSMHQVIRVLVSAGSLAFVSSVACLPWNFSRRPLNGNL